VDSDLEALIRTTEQSGRSWSTLVLSDHGQHEARPFDATYGMSLFDLVDGVLRSTSLGDVHTIRPRILRSGNLAHIYLSDSKALTAEGLEAQYPGLLGILRRHQGLGLVAARSESGGIWLGTPGHGAALTPGQPVPAKFALGPDAASVVESVHTLLRQEDSGDFALFGAEVDGRLISFLRQWGCHNGFLGDQTDAFVAGSASLDLNIPPRGVATALHQQLGEIRFGPGSSGSVPAGGEVEPSVEPSAMQSSFVENASPCV
jgi:hypothetical protein